MPSEIETPPVETPVVDTCAGLCRGPSKCDHAGPCKHAAVAEKLRPFKNSAVASMDVPAEVIQYDPATQVYTAVLSSMWANSQGQAVNPLGIDKSVISHSRVLTWGHGVIEEGDGGSRVVSEPVPIGAVVDLSADREHSYVKFTLIDSWEGNPSPNYLRACINAGVRFGVSPDYYAIESRAPTAKDRELLGPNTSIVISKSLPTSVALCIVPANLDAFMMNSAAAIRQLPRETTERFFNSVKAETWKAVYEPPAAAPVYPGLDEAAIRKEARRQIQLAEARRRGLFYI
jgi:hypothetical protein